MRTRINLLAIFIATTMVLLSTSTVWALGTADDQTISNQASVEFTIGGTTTTTTSNTETFAVDTKVRPIVTNDGGTGVVAGVNDFALPFTVTNEGNSAVGNEYFQLSVEADSTDDFDMSTVRIYSDVDGSGDLSTGDIDITSSSIVSISNVNGNNSLQYLIVANTPATGGTPDTGTPGLTAIYHLVATAWAGANVGDGATIADGNGNDPTAHEIVFADDAGTATGDVVLNGFHSDSGVFTTLATLGVAKVASDGTSGYHLPGDTVTYDIDVTNGDPVLAATNVVVTDSIPAQTTYVQITSCSGTAEWSIDNQTNWVGIEPAATSVTDIRCTIATIATGASETVSFEVTID